MTAFQQYFAKKSKKISIEMQRNRFETYHGGIWFLLEYRLSAVQGDNVKEGHSWSSRCPLF